MGFSFQPRKLGKLGANCETAASGPGWSKDEKNKKKKAEKKREEKGSLSA